MKISQLFEFRSKPEEELQIPTARMSRLRQSFQRRLCDSLEEVFYRSCVENDVRTAAGLFAVLEDLYIRRAHGRGSERRISDEALLKARSELDRCRKINEREQQFAQKPPAVPEWAGAAVPHGAALPSHS
ncbi:MAG: hypothetical protein EXR07_13465 [Acetobacteraceae bacterium]|nr:hypothetical protein [Acetobacteraceae bacterium]